MEAIVKALGRLITGGIVLAETTDDLVPYILGLEKHYRKALYTAPKGWVDVALDTAVTVYIATRNKEIFISTFYHIVNGYNSSK